MTTEQYARTLRNARGAAHEVPFPPTPGVYAIFLKPGRALADVPAAADGLLYIGTSGNLAQRGPETHFQTGKSGFSTLRRTIGALLKDDLHLHARPRSPGPSKSNTTNFRFTDAGETDLTLWMSEHLQVSFATVQQEDLDAVEKDLIRGLQPPLNLTEWANPYRQPIKRARTRCRREAQENHAHSG